MANVCSLCGSPYTTPPHRVGIEGIAVVVCHHCNTASVSRVYDTPMTGWPRVHDVYGVDPIQQPSSGKVMLEVHSGPVRKSRFDGMPNR